MRFWRFTLFQKSAVLIGVSLLMLGVSYSIEWFMGEELVLDSPMQVIQLFLLPYVVVVLGTEGHLTDPDDTSEPKLIKLWSILSIYFILLAIAFYLQWLPVGRGLFVMPLTTIVVTWPWVLWQRRRIHRKRANRT